MSKQFLRSLAIAAVFAGGYMGVDALSEPVVAEASGTVTVDGYQYPAEVVDAYNHLNDIRKSMGLHPYKLDPFITKAAQSHANYLVTHGYGNTPHTQTKGKAGFTGVDPHDRLKSAGYTQANEYNTLEGASKGYSSAKQFINAQLVAPYHRGAMVSEGHDLIGFGFNGKTWVLNVVKSNDTTETNGKYITYPYNGQTNAPTLFAGNERPDPLSEYGVKTSGTIITVSTPTAFDIFESNTITLKDSSGKAVPLFNTDAIEYGLAGMGAIPKTELKANTKYTATFDYVDYNGLKQSYSWSFTTGAKSDGIDTSTGGSNTGDTPTTPTKPPTSNSDYAKRFADFSATAWWASDMVWAIDRGLISGYGNVWNAKTKQYETQLQPNTQLTEAHFLTIFFRYAEKDELANVKNPNAWRHSGLYAMAKKYNMPTLASGDSTYSKGLADKGIRRGKLAQLMASHYYGKSVSEAEGIQFLMDGGITTATTSTEFNADKILTRSQISAFIQRYEAFVSTKK